MATIPQANNTGYTDPATIRVDPNYPVNTAGTGGTINTGMGNKPTVGRVGYSPANKKEREVRRQTYIRYYQMRDNDWRSEAEREWEMADKEYQLWMSDEALSSMTVQSATGLGGNQYSYTYPTQNIPDPDETRSHLKLPDAFAAIQSHMQETIGRKSRPTLTATNSSEEPVQEFANSVMNYNMNNTNFDYNYYMSGLSAAIRGTAFLYDYYRFEQRWVKDLDDVDNETGEYKYKDRLITDFDDDFTEWIPNEFCYIDEKARTIDYADDAVRREILNIRDFQRIYGMKKDFINQDLVTRGGETTTRSFFKLPKDITGNDVEVLHYYNRALDAYWVVANNVVVHYGPLPTKHKEIPFAVRYYYRVPGRFWGMGIPRIIHMLAEERNTIRNMNMDRQHMQLNKMFLHNNMYDIDEEDLVTRPGGLISIDTNGLPLNQALQPLEYGDVGPSYFKSDEIMIQDISRAIGIDLEKEEEPSATATAAALKQENYLKRIVMLATLDEMETIIRLGRLKWSNIQFFYPLGRMDTIYETREEKQQQVFKTITTDGQKFQIKDVNGTPTLNVENITGASSFELNKKMAKYMEGNFDISVDATQFTPVSRTVQQTRTTEMFTLFMSNPQTASLLDIGKGMARVLKVNDERPQDWLAGVDQDPGSAMLQAETENRVMAASQPLGPTPGATEEHTLIHIMFTQSQQYNQLLQSHPEIRQIFAEHIMGEHEANPATNSAAQAMSANGLGGNGTPGAPPGNPAMQGPGAAPPPGASRPTPPNQVGQMPNLPALGQTSQPSAQPIAQAAGFTETPLSKPVRTNV
jgi:hypothetical protein